MKNLILTAFVFAVLLPASNVRTLQDTKVLTDTETIIAKAVMRASHKNWYNVAVYLPDLKDGQRARLLERIESKGYRVTDGSGVNEIIVSW